MASTRNDRETHQHPHVNTGEKLQSGYEAKGTGRVSVRGSDHVESAYYLSLFLEDVHDQLAQVGQQLAHLERSADDAEALASVFREIHTFKGNAATVGFEDLAQVAHLLEQILAALHAGQLAHEPGVFKLLGRAVRALEVRLADALADRQGEVSPPVVAELLALCQQLPEPACPEGPMWREASEAGPLVLVRGDTCQVSIRLDPSCMLRSVRAQMIVSALETHSVVLSVAPPVECLEDPGEEGRLSLTIRTDVSPEGLQEQLLALGDVAEVVIVSTGASPNRPSRRVLDMFPLVVSDLASQLGKRAELIVEAADTTLPAPLASDLHDIVMHLVRNAVDHGIEPEAERQRAGKPPVGHLRLSLSPQGEAWVLRLQDDGRGLDLEAVRRRAVERRLISEEQAHAASERDLHALLLQAGISTAAEVTLISGRGVGLDAVQHRVARLGGSLHIESEAGRGTTFEIRFPLTDSLPVAPL
ncbi:MAG: ATP-binding protein [Candidatus Sericytochromatia bacterium]|nr:ATP-binding protein [Candidatus Sericytochromatia bacterium]